MSERGITRVLVLSLGAVMLLGYGCGPGGTYGKPLTGKTETPLGDVLDAPANFAGKAILVTGQIAKIENGGKTFMLDSGLGKYLAVECRGDFKIPTTAKYRLATVEGTLEAGGKSGDATLKATGVTIK